MATSHIVRMTYGIEDLNIRRSTGEFALRYWFRALQTRTSDVAVVRVVDRSVSANVILGYSPLWVGAELG